MSKNWDRLEWIRDVRKIIASECDNDPKLMGDYFRKIQKQSGKRILGDSDFIDSEEQPSRKSA